MRAAVIGGAGFIGAYVARALARRGVHVAIMDQQLEGNSLGSVLSEAERSALEFFSGSVTSLEDVRNCILGERADIVINLAALLTPDSQVMPKRALEINCGGMVNVLEIARDLHIRRVVWASSVSVFGPPSRYSAWPLDDDAPHYPETIYGATKSLCERYAAQYWQSYRVNAIGVRFAAVYGPGRIRGASSFATELIANPAMGLKGRVPYGDDRVNWQYVGDVADAIAVAAEVDSGAGRTFNFRGDVRSVAEAAELVRERIPSADLDLLPGTMEISWDCDGSRFERVLGYKSQYTLEAGVDACLAHYAIQRPRTAPREIVNQGEREDE